MSLLKRGEWSSGSALYLVVVVVVAAASVGAIGCSQKADRGGTKGSASAGSDNVNDSLVEAELPLPVLEVAKSSAAVDVPAVPAFEIPPPAPDGSRSVMELRVRGKKLLDTELTVRGFVTWVYDCVKAIREPGMSEKDAQKKIDQDPSVCERRKFYIGDSATTSPEKSLWVVDVPRPYFKIEMQRLPKEELRAPPPDRCLPNDKACPVYRVGDEVIIVGDFKLQSPHAERDSRGLLVYKAMNNITAKWSSPGGGAAGAVLAVGGGATAASAAPKDAAPKLASPPPRRASTAPTTLRSKVKIDKSSFDASMAAFADADKAVGNRQYDTAIERANKAVQRWDGNHAAWYAMARAYSYKGEWREAVDAAKRAVELAPQVAMYQLAFASSSYEAAVAEARTTEAAKLGVDPALIRAPDLSGVNLEKPQMHLAEALKLEPELWRAHYLLGSIHRAAGRWREAGEAFTRAVQYDAPIAAPWVALSELYRLWEHDAHAIAVAETGVKRLTGPEAALLWTSLAFAFADRGNHEKAIEAFTKALDIRRDDESARFGRGQSYFRRGDFAAAKRDLEEFAKSASPQMAFEKHQAGSMLAEIAAKAATP